MMNNIADITRIRQLYRRGSIQQKLFNAFASRQRNAAMTTIDQTLTSIGSTTARARREVTTFYRELEKAGCGKYVIGRHGGRSRFVWSVNMIDVGKAAAGESQPIEKYESTDSDVIVDDQPLLASLVNGQTTQHTFHLDQDNSVVITLPSHRILTSEAKVRLVKLIESLPVCTA